jgi:hypothetical protein
VRATPRPTGGAGSSRHTVTCPTRTPATSVIASAGPGTVVPMRTPVSRRLGPRRCAPSPPPRPDLPGGRYRLASRCASRASPSARRAASRVRRRRDRVARGRLGGVGCRPATPL